MLELSDEAIALGDEYIRQGAIPQSEPEDAYQIIEIGSLELFGVAIYGNL